MNGSRTTRSKSNVDDAGKRTIDLDTLKASIAKATATLVNHLDSQRENISIRAAESIITFAQKALEHENLEQRLEALEERIKHAGGNRR